MSHQDPIPLEHDLSRITPPSLPSDLLDRLEACASGTWIQLTRAELQFEADLRRRFSPVPIPSSLQAQLATCLPSATPTATTATQNPQQVSQVGSRPTHWWRSAAAVAIIGATAAWMLPTGSQPAAPLATNPAFSAKTPTPQTREFIPASVNRILNETRDEGVIWKPNQAPHRVLKVVYDEQVTLKDQNGKTYQLKQPKVEYFVVPTQPH